MEEVSTVAAEIGGHTFKRVGWSAHVAARLCGAVKADELAIASQVLDGQALCWEIDGGRSYMVTRVELPELVIVCYQGERVRSVMKAVLAQATLQGFRNLRFHTQWSKLVDMFRDLGPEVVEYVVRVPCGR